MLKKRKDDQLLNKNREEMRRIMENQNLMKQAWQHYQKSKMNPKLQVSCQIDNQTNVLKQIIKKKKKEDKDEIIFEEAEELESEEAQLNLASNDEDEKTEKFSNYDLSSELSHTKEQGGILEADLDVNEVNFNLIKGSRSFKPTNKARYNQTYSEIIEPSNGTR